mmetsp:Transcript_10346/g.25638  ORF Transcript_10346/g.25638 Transcript_10346/m.25638 type:complete len:161 (+) Transcript_10346:576-1058(+)
MRAYNLRARLHWSGAGGRRKNFSTRSVIVIPQKPVTRMRTFVMQGDREGELGLNVSPFMDRKKNPLPSIIINCQIGFINILVKPLLQEWTLFLGETAERDVMVPLALNTQLWETQGVATVDIFPPFLATSREVRQSSSLLQEPRSSHPHWQHPSSDAQRL